MDRAAADCEHGAGPELFHLAHAEDPRARAACASHFQCGLRQPLGRQVLAGRVRQITRFAHRPSPLGAAVGRRTHRRELVRPGDHDLDALERRGPRLAAIAREPVRPEHDSLGQRLHGALGPDRVVGHERHRQSAGAELARPARRDRGGLAQAVGGGLFPRAEPHDEHAARAPRDGMQQRRFEKSAGEIAGAHQRGDEFAAAAVRRAPERPRPGLALKDREHDHIRRCGADFAATDHDVHCVPSGRYWFLHDAARAKPNRSCSG